MVPTKWIREPAFWLCAFAVLCSILDRLFIRKLLPEESHVIQTQSRMFVGIISFCDRDWGCMVQELIDTASNPHQLRFGIVEYIRNVEETLEPQIPSVWRDIVRVYSVSHKTASTLRNAQKLCIEQLYDNKEPFVLLLGRSAKTVRDWDNKLLHIASADNVVSTYISSKGGATFPCLFAHGHVKHKPIATESVASTPSLLIQTDAILVPKDDLHTVLSSTNTLTVTARLRDAGKMVVTPTQQIFQRKKHPMIVPCGRCTRWIEPNNRKYAELNGMHIDTDVPSVNARIGLTHNADSTELISKYGSVLGARLIIQEESATGT